jgi:hypothetical protein
VPTPSAFHEVEVPIREMAPRPRAEEVPLLKSVTVVTVETPKRTERFLKRNRTIVLFVLLLIATDFAIGRFAPVWERHSPDDYAMRVQGCAREPRDLVFVGGSPVAEGIDPDRFVGSVGKSIYAMGLSGGTTSDFYHAVLRGCPSPPRVLVYGITASDLNDSRHEPHGPYSLMTWGDLGRWLRLRPESGEWAVRHFALARVGQASNLFRYRHGIRMWAACEADEHCPGSCPETMREADELRERADRLHHGNGYAPARGFATGNYAAVKAAGLTPKEFPYLAKYRTGSHLKYLHRLIDWCEAGGTRLLLIDMPVTADLEAMYGKEFSEYRTRLAEVERDRRVKVIHATRDAVGLGDGHFADLIHMNRDGATVFSDWLSSRLRLAMSKDDR